MTILVDWQIRKLCEDRLVEPYDPSLINPASLDVRIGNTAKRESTHGWVDVDLTQFSAEKPLLIEPKEFILVATLETFNMPINVAGEFKLKSSRAREGWDNCLAVWLDPNWTGSKLTLELINQSRYRHLPLYPGLKIGQIILYSCQTPERHYGLTGRYNGDCVVMGSKG